MEIFLAVVLVVAIVGSFCFWITNASDAFNTRIDEINKASGCSFSRDLFLGGANCSFLFDNANKKICILSGKEMEIQDYSYIRSWQLHWTERPGHGIGTYTNIYFAFATNDLARPIIKIKQHSKTHADEWNAKLGILFA